MLQWHWWCTLLFPSWEAQGYDEGVPAPRTGGALPALTPRHVNLAGLADGRQSGLHSPETPLDQGQLPPQTSLDLSGRES